MNPPLWFLLILFTDVRIGEGTHIFVEEGHDFIMECSLPNKDLTYKVFDWETELPPSNVFLYDAGVTYLNGRSGQHEHFKGRVSYFPEDLRNGNASIKITSAKVSDNGTYKCVFPREDPQVSTKVEVTVVPILKDRSHDQVKGASPKPCLSTVSTRPDSVQLICEVDGAFPEPKLEFRDGAGTTVPLKENQTFMRDRHFYARVSIHVTRTDNFTCVATQEQIHHQTTASTSVFIYSSDSSKVHFGWMVACVISIIFNVIFFLVLVLKRSIKAGHNKGPYEEYRFLKKQPEVEKGQEEPTPLSQSPDYIGP